MFGGTMNEKMLEKLLVNENQSIKDIMRKIDENGCGIALIENEKNRFMGLVTDGDIRRAILKGIGLEKPIKDIMNKEPVTVGHELTTEEREKLLKNESVRKKIPRSDALKIPVLDDEERVRGILFLYEREKHPKREVIMRSPISIDQENIKKVLIVGGAGYLGSILCRKLLARGYNVTVLDNLMYGDDGIRELYNEPNFDIVKGDARNLQTVTGAAKGVDAVIHLAAIVGDPASNLNPEETVEINYLASKMLAEICKYSQINRFIFASTCSVYGASLTPDTRLNEDSLLNPVSLYGEMKLRSEQAILELVDENFSPTIFRMATLYGLSPRMRFDLVINLLTAKAVQDRKITIFGGEQWRPFMHVEDAAEAYIKCLEIPINMVKGEIFNVGSNNQNYQIKDIGEIIKKAVPDAEIVLDREKADKRNYNISFDKMNEILTYESRYGVEERVIQIGQAIKNGKYHDYTDPKYSNYKFLQDKF